MMVEGAGWRKARRELTYSGEDAAVSTYFEGYYHSPFRRGVDDIPASINIRAHRFRLLGERQGLFVGMDEAVEMIAEKFDEPALEDIIAASGLKQHLASMRPKIGGAIIDEELNAQYLTPTHELEPVYPPSQTGHHSDMPYAWPLATMGTKYVQAEISAYDFPKMVSYTMSNTALQHVINSSLKSRQPVEDPRISLIESMQPEAVAA